MTNEATDIQAAEIHHEGGSFFGLQYHPEFNFGEIAGLARRAAKAFCATTFSTTPQTCNDISKIALLSMKTVATQIYCSVSTLQ